MSYIKDIIKEENQRLKALLKKYQDEIASLPKGSISLKRRRQRQYLYLAYRESGKVKFKYIGPTDSEKAKDIQEKVERRKQYELKIKQVKKDLNETEKAIHGR